MRIFLTVVLIFAALWDGFTTVYGTTTVLGTDLPGIVASVLFAGLIMAFLLNTRRIMMWETTPTSILARLFWFIALCYDFYTSWLGNSELLIAGSLTAAQTTILIGLALLVTASPVILSAMWMQYERADIEIEAAA